MAIGASGNRINVLAVVFGSTHDASGNTTVQMRWFFSEPTRDGNIHDGTMTNTIDFAVDFEPTDSEIIATLKADLAQALNNDYTPADPFLSTDIRGLAL